jgi:hypothetical protein
MPERQDAPLVADRAQPQPVPAAPEIRDQAPAEPEGYLFCVEERE